MKPNLTLVDFESLAEECHMFAFVFRVLESSQIKPSKYIDPSYKLSVFLIPIYYVIWRKLDKLNILQKSA